MISDQSLALAHAQPSVTAEPDSYQVFCATIAQSARGRWFLEEHARRSRQADIQLVLTAISRLESVIRGRRGPALDQALRGELLRMAEAIAQTRREVATLRAGISQPPAPPPDGGAPEPGDGEPDIRAAAERIRDVTWEMREHGFDLRTCDQLDKLAIAILAAAPQPQTADLRARKLGDALQDLERRLRIMLETGAERPVQAADSVVVEFPTANVARTTAPEPDGGLPPGPGPIPEQVVQVATADVLPAAMPVAVATPDPAAEPSAGDPEPTVTTGEFYVELWLAPPAPESAAPAAPADAGKQAADLQLEDDPLAALKAMTDEERIALFS
jgi:hypothetical protein